MNIERVFVPRRVVQFLNPRRVWSWALVAWVERLREPLTPANQRCGFEDSLTTTVDPGRPFQLRELIPFQVVLFMTKKRFH